VYTLQYSRVGVHFCTDQIFHLRQYVWTGISLSATASIGQVLIAVVLKFSDHDNDIHWILWYSDGSIPEWSEPFQLSLYKNQVISSALRLYMTTLDHSTVGPAVFMTKDSTDEGFTTACTLQINGVYA